MTSKRKLLAGSVAASALALALFVTFQIVATSGLGSGKSPDQGPRAVFGETSLTLGKVPQWQILELSFPVQNVGQADLVLQPDVSCSSDQGRANVKDTNIAPGSSGDVSVRIDVGELQGPQKVLFVVQTNDPALRTVSIQIEFDVEGRFWVEPRSIALGPVAPSGDIPPRLVKVRWQKQRKVVIQELKSHDPWVQVTSRPFEEGGIEGVDLELTFGPFEIDSQSDFSRSLRTMIEMETNHESHRKILIPVTASLQRAVIMAPRILELGVVGVGDKLHDVIDVRSVTGQPFRILEVTSSAPYIRTQVQEIDPGLRYSIKLWIEPLEALGAVETVITVKTDAPFCEELGCRITGVVNP